MFAPRFGSRCTVGRMVHYLKFFPSDWRLSYNTHLSAFADIVTTSHLVMSTDCVNPHRT